MQNESETILTNTNWPESDERIENIGRNGNDGLHYWVDDVDPVRKWDDYKDD
ncbi:hypothetical protein KC887_04710 [Candidatus Kaiserbacteria bacterium]|nr:hypothetical protein [Candidatus Kaiserbacteria bacterium]